MWISSGGAKGKVEMPPKTKTVPFHEVKEVNEAFRTFVERRRKLLELLYGRDVKHKRSVPTKWLDEDSLTAAQSLVDSHLAKFVQSQDGASGELIRPKKWIFPRGSSIDQLAEL